MLDVQWNTINGRHLQTIFVNDYILFICNFRLQTFAESTDGEMLAQLYSVNFDAFFFCSFWVFFHVNIVPVLNVNVMEQDP